MLQWQWRQWPCSGVAKTQWILTQHAKKMHVSPHFPLHHWILFHSIAGLQLK
jgi:DUF1365 family protein